MQMACFPASLSMTPTCGQKGFCALVLHPVLAHCFPLRPRSVGTCGIGTRSQGNDLSVGPRTGSWTKTVVTQERGTTSARVATLTLSLGRSVMPSIPVGAEVKGWNDIGVTGTQTGARERSTALVRAGTRG